MGVANNYVTNLNTKIIYYLKYHLPSEDQFLIFFSLIYLQPGTVYWIINHESIPKGLIYFRPDFQIILTNRSIEDFSNELN